MNRKDGTKKKSAVNKVSLVSGMDYFPHTTHIFIRCDVRRAHIYLWMQSNETTKKIWFHVELFSVLYKLD